MSRVPQKRPVPLAPDTFSYKMFLRDVVPTLFFVLTLIFFFTAPKLFPIAYSLVKPFLNEVTRNKIKIFGGMSVAPFFVIWSVLPLRI